MAQSSGGDLWKILGAIVTVALVTAVLAKPAAGQNIAAIGNSFANILRSAMSAGG